VCCDNRDCIYYDDYRGCDVDELVIDHGVCAGSAGHGRNVSQNDLDERLRAENLQLRQRMDKLIRILYNDYDLSIQLDGLRKFWHVGLTDEGVRKRDERDAEVGLLQDQNAKLRELLGLVDLYERRGCGECQYKVRCDSCDSWTWSMCEVWKRIDQLQRELGIEVVES
jgi:hypothetical protein